MGSIVLRRSAYSGSRRRSVLHAAKSCFHALVQPRRCRRLEEVRSTCVFAYSCLLAQQWIDMKRAPELPTLDYQPIKYGGPSAEQVLQLRKGFLNPGIFLHYKKPLMLVEGKMQ